MLKYRPFNTILVVFVSAAAFLRQTKLEAEAAGETSCYPASVEECGPGLYCCGGSSYEHDNEPGWCKPSCVGISCGNDNYCAPNECCRRYVCTTKCGCESNFDCPRHEVQYRFCCKERKSIHSPHRRTFCNSTCVGINCDENSDCGGLYECCIKGKCIERCCKFHSHCKGDLYCCKEKGAKLTEYERELRSFDSFEAGKTICNASCVGGFCRKGMNDCGGPYECCIDEQCSTECCKSNPDCPHEQYCCREKHRNFCSSSCVGLSCNGDNDCGGPDECYRSNTCTTRGCLILWIIPLFLVILALLTSRIRRRYVIR